ncbi:MAG: CocE/NonD family hydrolase [Bryobacterales bacterium]|jgi:uncharacterized protein|nr:CocE/NonD family hydrolase [Bryobacterales bacterium]
MRFAILAALLPVCAPAQGLEYVKANFTKYEHRIPMRDGKRLFTSVYVPKDASPEKRYPILLNRTPYGVGPYGADKYKGDIGPSDVLAKEGYIFVYQDVRGRNYSEGEFINMTPHKASKSGPQDVDESTDTYDTIDWLLKSIPHNNGRVGTYGISYPGFYTTAGMIDAHPAHKAASPQAPIADWFIGDDFHRNGAFYLPHAFNFFAGFGKPRPEPTEQKRDPFPYGTPDGYDFYLRMGTLTNANERYFKNDIAFWNEMMRQPNYTEFWQSRNIRVHTKNIRPAVMVVGGWFDTENLFGALETYRSVEKLSPGTFNVMVMGPWWHGQWARDDGAAMGNATFNQKTGPWYRENVEAPFFNYYLKDKGELKLAEATVFEMGSNVWRRHDAWPPRAARSRTLYFHPKGSLSWDPPKDSGAFDEYLSDPAKPVPFTDQVSTGMTREHMTDDQRFATRRPDVLVYQTEPLEEDLVIAGPLAATLHVSTTGGDADWIVKLIDVYPDDRDEPTPQGQPAPRVKLGGYQQLVRGEVFRGRFRNSFEKPEPFQPGVKAKVEYNLNDVYHNFRRGHRLMIHVQSTWFPLVDRNPQKYVDIYTAKESDFQKATHRVYREAGSASGVKVLTLP